MSLERLVMCFSSRLEEDFVDYKFFGGSGAFSVVCCLLVLIPGCFLEFLQ